MTGITREDIIAAEIVIDKQVKIYREELAKYILPCTEFDIELVRYMESQIKSLDKIAMNLSEIVDGTASLENPIPHKILNAIAKAEACCFSYAIDELKSIEKRLLNICDEARGIACMKPIEFSRQGLRIVIHILEMIEEFYAEEIPF